MRKGEKEKGRKGEREKGERSRGWQKWAVSAVSPFFAIFFRFVHVGEFCPSPNGLISGCGGSPRRLGKEKEKKKRRESHEEKGKGD